MVNVTKASGHIEPFSEKKVKSSISRAGIPKQEEQRILNHVKEKIYDGIKTSEIYHHITEFLETHVTPHAKAKYSLKRAIMELGPTGYPFEDFVAEILKTQGYSTTVRNILIGQCITHEIDVIAQKDLPVTEKIMVEAKFHNLPGTRTNVHVSLYTKARFDDIKEKNGLNQAWIVTNTKATTDAIDYSLCNNIKIITWSFPQQGSLRELIEASGLSPITALTTLSNNQKQLLLENRQVLCKSLHQSPSLLDPLGISEEHKKTVLEEVRFVCNL